MIKRKIVYITALIVVLGTNIFYVEYQLWIALLVMLIFPIVMYTYIALIKNFIDVSVGVSESIVVRGDETQFEIVVNNQSILPAQSTVIILKCRYDNSGEFVENRFVVNAKEFERTRITGTMAMNYCGNVTVSIKSVYLYDAVKLFKVRVRHSEQSSVIVMPKLVTPDYYTVYMADESVEDAQEYSKTRSGDDVSEIFDIREYRDGDRISQVHWKLSAKEDKLFIKEYSNPINKSNVILLELISGKSEDELMNLDGVYELAYAIAHFACTREKEFKIAYYSVQDSMLKVVDIYSLDALTDAVAMIIKESTYSNNPYALKELLAGEIVNYEHVYYITPSMDKNIERYIDEAERGRIFVYHITGNTVKEDYINSDYSQFLMVNRDDIKQSLKTVIL